MEPSRVIHGRVAAQVVLACHQIAQDLGLKPKSHWHAVRIILEMTCHAMKKRTMMLDWTKAEDELLNSLGQKKMSVRISSEEIESAMKHLSKYIKLGDQPHDNDSNSGHPGE